MPVRIVCPACSAALSVKDEFTGRAVKCPKCGGVIPPSQPAPPATPSAASPAPPAPPEPEKPAPENADEPAKSKPGSKVVGRPVARAVDTDEDADRPRRKDRDDRDRDDRDDDRDAKSKKGDRDEKDGDRRDKRRRRDEDDADERPAKAEKKGGNSGLLIVLIICGTLLLCCGGVGGGVWYVFYRVKKGVDEVVDNVEKWNPSVTIGGYERLQVGTTTRGQSEQQLGKGKLATTEDVEKIFGADAGKVDKWVSMVAKGRAVIWRNGDDFLLAAFHPNAEADARLMMKEWRPKNGATASAGDTNDTEFVRKYPAISPTTEIRAEDLSKENKDNWTAADEKYKGKTFIVTGKFIRFNTFGNEPSVLLEGSPPSGPDKFDGREITCKLAAGQNPFAYSRGQRLKVSGKCTGGIGGLVTLEGCSIKSGEADPSVKVSADKLIADYADKETADATYKGKELTITGVRIEKIDGGVATGTLPGKKSPPRTIAIFFDSELKNKFTNLRVGATLTVKGKCTALAGDAIHIDDAWFVP